MAAEQPKVDGVPGSFVVLKAPAHPDVSAAAAEAGLTMPEIVAEQAPYLRDRALSWAIAEPFDQWWARHRELHRHLAA